MKPDKLWSILLAVSSITQIDANLIISKSRKRQIVEARHLLCGIARTYGYSLKEIGKLICRDHSSVIYAGKSYRNLCQYNDSFREKSGKVQQQLNLIFKTIATMKNVDFENEPQLWPEEYTDCFNIEKNANKDIAEKAIEAAMKESDFPPVFIDAYFLYTSDQLLVDNLKDQLYGSEISFRHTHIPEHYG